MAAPPFPWTTGPCIWPSSLLLPGNPENVDLYSTRYSLMEDTGDEQVYLWTEPEPIAALNTPDGWESQPAISPDGQTLYFAAIRPGTTPDEQATRPSTFSPPIGTGTQWTGAASCRRPSTVPTATRPLPPSGWTHPLLRLQPGARRWRIRHLDVQARQPQLALRGGCMERAPSTSAHR